MGGRVYVWKCFWVLCVFNKPEFSPDIWMTLRWISMPVRAQFTVSWATSFRGHLPPLLSIPIETVTFVVSFSCDFAHGQLRLPAKDLVQNSFLKKFVVHKQINISKNSSV